MSVSYPMKLGGQTYEAYPLRDCDHETLTNWCCREYLDRTRVASKADRILVLEQIALITNWQESPLTRKMVFTVEGLYQLAKLMTRNADLPRDAVACPEGVVEVGEVYAAVHQAEAKRLNLDDLVSNSKDPGEEQSGN